MTDRLLKALRSMRISGRIYPTISGTDGHRMALRGLISHHARFQHSSRRMLDSELSTLDDLTGKVKQKHSSTIQRLPRPEALEPQVILKRLGYVHEFRLNRPKALNALNPSMIQSLRQQIPIFESSPHCSLVVGASTSSKGFCAGGDVKEIVRQVEAGQLESMMDFFRSEYRLLLELSSLSKPYISIMDGVTMGGGAGLAMPATFRIATERTKFAMPETAIGYSPDVGSTFWLNKLDGGIGMYLALTGKTLSGADAYRLGLATHYFTSDQVEPCLQALREIDSPSMPQITDRLALHESEPLEHAERWLTGAVRETLDVVFSKPSMDSVLTALAHFTHSTQSDIAIWAKQTISTLQSRSPTSLLVTFQAMSETRQQSYMQCLKQELRTVYGFLSGIENGSFPDFKIGVQQKLVQKSSSAIEWLPANFKEVNHEQLQKHFSKNDKARDVSRIDQPKLQPFALRGTISEKHQALPTEDALRDIIIGAHPASGHQAMTTDELSDLVGRIYGPRPCLQERLADVISRKCATDKDGFLSWRR